MTFAQPFHEYEILDRVGAGAMGTVFKARHKRLNRIVALKVLKPSLARDSRYVDRLKREARIVASLSHPNIVTGFDLGEEGGYHYFVMEFVEGKSLRGMLFEWGMFAEEYVRRVARQVALALDHAYQRGVIHRDIKPGNILIDEAGNVKLTDMGLAKGPADLTLTRDGATVGTPQYISPEQARNPHDVDVRTDLYSLGATLYHMATGVPPFRGDTMAELITNVLHELPVSPKAINSALSDGMSLVIRKLLAKDLTVRYQTPRELLDDLDRLEKSLPPRIDPDRLSAEEVERSKWWPRVLLGIGVAGLAAAAWWLGGQTRVSEDVMPSADEFVAALDQQLARLPTPGARFAHLRTVQAAPLGSASELAKRQRTVDGELQQAVDAVVSALAGAGWAGLEAWIREPSAWPDRERILRERVQPSLLEQVGFPLGQLPASVRRGRLDELQQAIDRTLAERDQALVTRFELYLATKLPEAVEARLLASDFAAAERSWSDGLASFCDGVSMPLPERLPDPVHRLMQERFERAGNEVVQRLDAAEREVADAMREEVATVCSNFAQALRGDLVPDAVGQQLQRFRHEFGQTWPSAIRFRADRSPWSDIERQFGILQADIDVAIERHGEQRFSGRLDFVWRAFCHGSADDALLLLPDEPEPGSRALRVQHHRTLLLAARAVESAMLEAIGRAQVTVAFLRAGSAPALELRREPDGAGWRLVGNTTNQSSRPVRLAELRFGELLERMQREADPLAALPLEVQTLGVAVFRLVGDDLAGVGRLLAAVPDEHRNFLADDVQPRIQRVREERPDSPLDRQHGFARLRQAREAAARTGVEVASRTGALDELQNALAVCENLVPALERSKAEETELREAGSWLVLAQRQQQLVRELGAAAPRGSEIDVRIVGERLVAEVALAAAQLHGDAAEGWQVRGDVLDFASGGRPWSDADQQQLRGNAGIEPNATRTTLTIDLVLPPTTVGRRFWVLEFRGIACVLVLGANDTVYAALVDGDPRREEHVQKAFGRALSGLLAPNKSDVVVVPGAVHRLTFDLLTDSRRTSARVTVRFEGQELFPPERRALDPLRPPTFAVHPQQDVAVRRVVVRAEGL